MSVPYLELRAALILLTRRKGGEFAIRKSAQFTYVNVPLAVTQEAESVLNTFGLRYWIQDRTDEFCVIRLMNPDVTDWPAE